MARLLTVSWLEMDAGKTAGFKFYFKFYYIQRNIKN